MAGAEAGFGLHVTCRPIGVNDAEEPKSTAADLKRHSDNRADDAEIEVEAEEFKAADSDQVGNPLLVVPEVEMPQAGHDCKRGGHQGILPSSKRGSLVSPRGGRPTFGAGSRGIRQERSAATA